MQGKTARQDGKNIGDEEWGSTVENNITKSRLLHLEKKGRRVFSRIGSRRK